MTTIRFPIRLLTVSLVLTILTLAGFGWSVLDARQDVTAFTDTASRIEELRGVIVHLDEVLTMSARMAASSGDSRWEERYRQFEPQLEAAINATKNSAHNPADIRAATAMNEANVKLVEMENLAFALIRAGRKEEAQRVLSSPEYETQKKLYTAGALAFTNQIRREFDDNLLQDLRFDWLLMIAALVVGGISVLAWFSAARGMQQWRLTLERSASKRAQAERALRLANDELDFRVQQRTAELAATNKELRVENAERRRSQDALREGEERYRELFDNAKDAIYVHDLDGTYTSANRAAERLTGYTRDELIGMNFTKLLAPEFADAIHTRLSQKLVEDSETVYEVEVVTKDGHRVPIEVSSRLIYENGLAVGVQGTGRDITERKRAEAERQAISEIVQGVITTTSLDELFKLAHQAISKPISAENCFIALYDKVSDLLHIPFCKDEFDPVASSQKLGKGLTAYVLRSGRPMLMTPERIQKLVAEGEIELVGTLPAAWLGVPLRTSTETIGVLVVQHYENKNAYNQRDLELLASVADQLGLAIQRKQIEIELKTNEMRLTEAQHIASLGNWEWDIPTNAVRWSTELYRIFGIPAERSASTFGKFLTYVHPEDLEMAERAIGEALHTKVFPNLDFRIVRTDGAVRAVHSKGQVVVDETGQVTGMWGTVQDITERKRAEEAMIESDRRFRDLFYDAPVGYHELDTEGRITCVNTTELLMLGYSSEEMIGHHVWEFIEEADIARATFAEKLAGIKPLPSVERSFRRKDGTLMEVQLDDRMLYDPSGRIIGIRATMQDIVERKQAEQALRDSEERFRELVENANDVIYTVDFEGNFTSLNKSGERALGYTREEALHLNLANVVSPENLKLVQAISGRKVTSPDQTIYEIEVIRKSGESFLAEISSRAIFKNGKPVGIQGIGRDITERKRAGDALRDSEERYRLLFESNPCPAWVYDLETLRFLAVNPAAVHIYGYSHEDFVAMTIADIRPPEDVPALLGSVDIAKTGSETPPHFWRHLKKDGSSIDVEITSHALTFDGRPAEIVLASDVTERKQLELGLIGARDAAIESSRVKSEFLANMSHEIRTPMNGILGMTELTLDTDLNSDQREYLEIVKSSTHSLLTVINDILDFSKIEAGKLDLEMIDFSLQEAIGGATKAIALPAHEKGLELVLDLSNVVRDRLVGDPGRLRQIITNLLGNAVKFTQAGKIAVRVAMETETDTETLLHFSVSDTGIGIPIEKQSLIFGAFAQADGSTTRRYGGTGLGLAICAQLVEIMGGRIWVESQEGTGSTFHFTARFALQTEPQTEPVVTSPPGTVNPGARGLAAPLVIETAEPLVTDKPIRFLLAEDNDVNQKLVVWLLQKRGHSVTLARNGNEAVALLQAAPFDIVLMDVQMPEMNGLEATQIIRRIETSTGAHIPIIAMTALAMKGDRELCLEAGMDDYISKPIRADQVFQTVERLLKKDTDCFQPVPEFAATAVATAGFAESGLLESGLPESGSPAPAASGSAFDEAALRSRVDDNIELMGQLIELFQEEWPSVLVKLRTAIEQGEANIVSRLSHQLKGSAAIFGADAVIQSSQRLEDMGRNNDLSETTSELANLDRELNRLQSELNAACLQGV